MAYYNFNYPPELNPFLDDDDSVSSAGSYSTVELPQPNFATPPLPPMSNFKLQAFWPDAPVAWFSAAEAQFTLWRVMSQAEAANGQQIPCWGWRQVSFYFGSRHYSCSFLLADVDFNILGVDFLQHFQLTVDVAAKQLWH